MARSGILQERSAEEHSTLQEDVDTFHGPGQRRLQQRTALALLHSPCEVPDDEAATCEGVRVWELPC